LGPDSEDDETTILGLATVIRFLLGCGPDDCVPEFYPPRPAEVFEAHCSAAKARRLLGYKPRWELQRGLDAYIEWIKSKGARPFEYHLPLEIVTKDTPKTWTDKLM
jgi:UDP-glucose 4-epimerase